MKLTELRKIAREVWKGVDDARSQAESDNLCRAYSHLAREVHRQKRDRERPA